MQGTSTRRHDRRTLLLAGAAALLSPMLGRADQPGDDYDPDRLEIGARAVGGRTRHTGGCGSTYEVAYAGTSAYVESGGPHAATYRAEIGGERIREREVANDDDDPVDPEVSWSESLSVLGMVGEDWRYFGVLFGGGFLYLEDPYPLVALAMRIGPRRPLRLDVHLLDYVPIHRALAGIEGVLTLSGVEVAFGVRGHLDAEGPTATVRIDLPVVDGLRLGLLIGGEEMAGAWVTETELWARVTL